MKRKVEKVLKDIIKNFNVKANSYEIWRVYDILERRIDLDNINGSVALEVNRIIRF